ncbi:carboxypeptidase-like regulatory domain-containing protein [Cellvibrio mixtus]|uniref:carboxypeptidase-like regulatory domain-containing protein n=1 Tax=Cellvibrio mixtus TaxID=39650 RepID=UPI0005865ED3|nr:carboxypeptidase-like regulatory domain-containing protein [Cellvibrio mixtus]
MKKIIGTCLSSIALVSAILTSTSALSHDVLPASGQYLQSVNTSAAHIEPNYEEPLVAPLVDDFVYVDPNTIIDISPAGKNKTKANNVSASKLNGSITPLSSPPVYSISLNNTYSDSVTTAVPEKWYVFNVTTATKITTLLQHQSATNSNIDIKLYRQPTGTSSYTLVAGSYMGGASAEQLSEIAVPGSYLLMVQSVGTIVGGSYLFGNFSSSGADANEPDDNFWQAKVMSSTLGLISGNLDTGTDKDFHRITLSAADTISYRITGGDYHAELFYANGTSAFVLPNNTFANLTLPAGTYYWAIKSPTNTANASVPYKFSSSRALNRITFNFGSDEGYTARVDYGQGNFFAFKSIATLSGYAYDANNAPVAGAVIEFRIIGSISGLNSSAFATTDAAGYYTVGLPSPSGAGARTFNGACLIYNYDVHSLEIRNNNGNNNINTIRVIESTGQFDISNSQMFLNDIAYYTYTGC